MASAVIGSTGQLTVDTSGNVATSGTLSGILPNPSASTLGGVKSITCSASQWIDAISTAGTPICARPALTDLSDYASSAGAGLTLNLSAGGAFCGNPPALVSYAGGTLTLTASQTNYVYLDPAQTCIPAFNITGFLVGQIPLAKVVAGASTITTITDMRGAGFAPLPCAMSAAGAVGCSALGTDQNITLTPSGTGSVINHVGVDQNLWISNNGGVMRLMAINDAIDANVPVVFQATDYTFTSAGAAITWLRYNSTGALTLTAGGTNQNTTLTPSGTGHVTGTSFVGNMNTVTSSATMNFDASLGNTQTTTLTLNVTAPTLSNPMAGEWLTFDILQDATGGRTFVWPTNVLNAGTIGTTLSKHNIQTFYCDGTNCRATAAMLTNQN
jgi:hypothetical protein